MSVTAHEFQSLYVAMRKPLAQSNHRTILPQSALWADSSLREGSGSGLWRLVPFIGVLAKSNVAGDFHRPYESSGNFTLQTQKSPAYWPMSFR